MEYKIIRGLYLLLCSTLFLYSCTQNNQIEEQTVTSDSTTLKKIAVLPSITADTNKIDSIYHTKITRPISVVQNNYSLLMTYILIPRNGTLYKEIWIAVEDSEGIFEHRAPREYIHVTDGTTIEYPFGVKITADQKRLIGYFAVDAFDNMTGPVSIIFGYEGSWSQGFDSVIINNLLMPLDPMFNGFSHTDVTKALLGPQNYFGDLINPPW